MNNSMVSCKGKKVKEMRWFLFFFLALEILMEMYRGLLKELPCVFIDLEMAFDWVPREVLW